MRIFQSQQRYGVIYSDPPWLYDDARTHASAGMARSAYECMPLKQIKALPVATLAARDCMLCLWATMPKLPEALQVIESWGFKYITCGFVWIKQNRSGIGIFSGLGHWVNGNAELVLLGRKGHPVRKVKDIKQIVLEPVGAHSRKPEEVRRRIELLLDGPYIELFGRRRVPHWDVWGDQVQSDIILTDAD
jgi:N6-adenosine-specific RNA methylase IME4